MTHRIEHSECRAFMRSLPPESVHSIVTDPPYGIEFMGAGWDVAVPGVEFWREALRVLMPGGHVTAFGGTQKAHRLTCAIEDAGFEIRDQLMWMFGQGKPRSGSSLKPAYEPIVLARKPLIGTIAENMAAFGVGALNVNACRIPGPPSRGGIGGNGMGYNGANGTRQIDRSMSSGRWPANVVLDEEAAEALDAQTGILKSGFLRAGTLRNAGNLVYSQLGGVATDHDIDANAGGASRFFYVAKASTAEREAGLFSPSGKRVNEHPTVKPISLGRWLTRLVTPPGGTVLDIFCGSGSLSIGAALEGFSVLACDLDAKHVSVARARVAYALSAPELFAVDDASDSEVDVASISAPVQGSLF